MGLLDLLLGVFKCNHLYYIKYFFSIHFIVQVCFLLNFVHVVLHLLSSQDSKYVKKCRDLSYKSILYP